MSILREIQSSAVDGSTPIADVLRQCAVLAARIDNTQLRDWVSSELSGYSAAEELPPYRILSAYAQGHFIGPLGSGYRNLGIPSGALPERYRAFAQRVYLRQPIAEIAALAKSDASKGTLSCPWPPDLVLIVAEQIYQDLQLVSAWQNVSHAELHAVVDAVRNRVLRFSLELERIEPTAGEVSAPPVSNARVGQLFQTIIIGNVNNVAAGGENIQQTSFNVTEGNWASLATYLKQVGVPAADVDELKQALDADGKRGEIGNRTAGWIARLVQKATSGVLKIGSSVASGLIIKAIGKYLGIP